MAQLQRVMKSLALAIWILVGGFYPLILHATPEQPIKNSVMHISVPLQDMIYQRYHKYLRFAYNHIGYQVKFEPILLVRAYWMISQNKLDGIMIAEQNMDIETKEVIKIPVLLASGNLLLICVKKVTCNESILENKATLIGITRGDSLSLRFLRDKNAESYEVKGSKSLGEMLKRGHLKYILTIYEQALGDFSKINTSDYQHVKIIKIEGYHFIHKKHQQLVPALTEALKLAIKEYGPLIANDDKQLN